MKGEEELSVSCIKVVVKGNGKDERILKRVVYMMKSSGLRTEHWGTSQEVEKV